METPVQFSAEINSPQVGFGDADLLSLVQLRFDCVALRAL
jgi:hypothetical protein